MKILCTLLLLGLVGCSSSPTKPPPAPRVYPVVISWPSVNESEDGQPLTDLQSYFLRYGTNSLDKSLEIPATSNGVTLSLAAGQWQFQLQARSASLGLSSPSNLATKSLP